MILSLSTPMAGCSAIRTLLGREPGAAKPGELRDRENQTFEQSLGSNFFRCTLRYEGGQHETWAYDDADRCPPDVARDKKLGPDDTDLQDPTAPTSTAPKIAIAVPDWCAAYDGWGSGSDWTSNSIRRRDLETATPEEQLEFAQHVAVAGCDRRNYRPRQAWVASWLQQWVNATKMDLGATKVLFSELVQRRDAVAQARSIGCGGGPLVSALVCTDDVQVPTSYRLDELEVTGKLDEHTRLSYLARCQGPLCHIDAEAVDWGAAPSLVAADAELAIIRFLARARLRELQAIHTRPTPQSERAVAAYRGWKEVMPQGDPLLPSAYAIVTAAVAKQEVPACPDGLRAAVDARLQATEPTSVDDARKALTDPWTQLLFRALTLCDREHPELGPLWGTALASVEQSWLGPRRSALIELGAYGLERLPPDRWDPKPLGDGVVVKVVPHGDGELLVRLESREWTEPLEKCWETRRIDGIRDDGSIRYRVQCKKIGTTRVEVEPEPLVVSKAEGKLLTKGQYVTFHAERTEGAYTERHDGKNVAGNDEPRKAVLVTVQAAPPSAGGGPLLYWIGFQLAK